jgi:hypothetical protein
MGLDQHRAQITAEWLDTETGEVSRARVMPADRDGVRRFLSRFAGRQLEVALEATTGWRFVVEEVRATRSTCVASHSSAISPKVRRVGATGGDERRTDATNSSRSRRASMIPTSPSACHAA